MILTKKNDRLRRVFIVIIYKSNVLCMQNIKQICKHLYLLCLSSFIKILKKTASWYISYYLLFPIFFLKKRQLIFFSLYQKKLVEWINQNLIISRTMYSFAWRNLGILITFLQIINTFIMRCFAYSINFSKYPHLYNNDLTSICEFAFCYCNTEKMVHRSIIFVWAILLKFYNLIKAISSSICNSIIIASDFPS